VLGQLAQITRRGHLQKNVQFHQAAQSGDFEQNRSTTQKNFTIPENNLQLNSISKSDSYVDSNEYNPHCPNQHLIHPCRCKLIDLRNSEDEHNLTELVDSVGPHTPRDLIETVVHCTNIHHRDVMREAIRGFRGHRVNFLIIDSCHLPPFPNNWFAGIDIKWMELLNMSVQFSDNFQFASSK